VSGREQAGWKQALIFIEAYGQAFQIIGSFFTPKTIEL